MFTPPKSGVLSLDGQDPPTAKVYEMISILNKYSMDLPRRHVNTEPSGGGMHRTILLTGSTGTLGSHVLAHLLSVPSNRRVVVVIRRGEQEATPLDRLTSAFRLRELDVESLSSERLSVLEGDATQPNFGLSNATYHEVRSSYYSI